MICSSVPILCRNPASSSAISVSIFTRILSSMIRRRILLACETRAIIVLQFTHCLKSHLLGSGTNVENVHSQYRRQSLASRRPKGVLGGHSERYTRKNPGHSPVQGNFFLWRASSSPHPPLAPALSIPLATLRFRHTYSVQYFAASTAVNVVLTGCHSNGT